MLYQSLYSMGTRPYDITSYISHTFTLIEHHRCTLSIVTYDSHSCKHESTVKNGTTVNIDNVSHIIVSPKYYVASLVMRYSTKLITFVFYTFPSYMFKTTSNYHHWIWGNNNLILLPNLHNDPTHQHVLHFKNMQTIDPINIHNIKLSPNTCYTHPDIRFKIYVDSKYPISVYNQLGDIIMGQNLLTGSYIDISCDLKLSGEIRISCNELISHKSQSIILVNLGVYDKNKFLFADHLFFRVAPIIFTPNCLPVDIVFLSKISGQQNNFQFVNDVVAILKKHQCRYDIIKQNTPSSPNRWLQDVFKFCYVNNNDHYQYILLKGPRFENNITQFQKYPRYDFYFDYPKNLDAFGNIQVVPPMLPDYPLGRIIYGVSVDQSQENISYNLIDLLESQQIQKPFTIETGWLNVGHVDEIVTFIPDPNTTFGFRVLIADTNKFFQIIKQLDPNLYMFDNDQNHYIIDSNSNSKHTCKYHTQIKISDLLNWNEMIMDNAVYQHYLNKIKQVIIDQTHIKPTEIYDVPVAYWPKSIMNRAAPIMPNLINNVYMNDFMIVPKPFGPQSNHIDLFETYFKSIIPKNIHVYFVNNWNSLYVYEGNINCAINIKRKPFQYNWWYHMPPGAFNI